MRRFKQGGPPRHRGCRVLERLTAEIGMRRPAPFDAVPIMVCKNALFGANRKETGQMQRYHKQERHFTVGLDLSDKKRYYVILDGDGEVVEEGKVATTTKALQRKFGNVEPMLIALEAGTHSGWVSRLLESLGHEVLIANPRRLRMIYENKNKGDRVDAYYLARVARVDPKVLHPIQHRTEEAQQDLMK